MKPGDRVIIYRPAGSLYHMAPGMIEYMPPDGAEWPIVVSCSGPVAGRNIGSPGMAVTFRDELLPDHAWSPEPPVATPDVRIPQQVIDAQQTRWEEYVLSMPAALTHQPAPVEPPKPEPVPGPPAPPAPAPAAGSQTGTVRPSQGQMFPRGVG